jgi:mono/diheme cytochrome c family protein
MRYMTFTILAGLLAIAVPAHAQADKGAAVYTAQKCGICHSIAGKGNAKGPLADEIREWIVDAPGMTAKTKAPRKPFMKSYSLPKDDLDALVAYLASLKK